MQSLKPGYIVRYMMQLNPDLYIHEQLFSSDIDSADAELLLEMIRSHRTISAADKQRLYTQNVLMITAKWSGNSDDIIEIMAGNHRAGANRHNKSSKLDAAARIEILQYLEKRGEIQLTADIPKAFCWEPCE
jgi:hypothetical protein